MMEKHAKAVRTNTAGRPMTIVSRPRIIFFRLLIMPRLISNFSLRLYYDAE